MKNKALQLSLTGVVKCDFFMFRGVQIGVHLVSFYMILHYFKGWALFVSRCYELIRTVNDNKELIWHLMKLKIRYVKNKRNGYHSRSCSIKNTNSYYYTIRGSN